MKRKKLLIIGIDGLSPKLLKLLIKKKIFTNIGKIVKSGVYGDLESTIPPYTAPAWTSFATGVNPGKHGIFNFLKPNQSLDQLDPITSNNIAYPTFYQKLNNSKKKCILINLPITWPPLTKNPTITSLLTGSNNPVHPKSLIKQFPFLKNYQITPKNPKFLHFYNNQKYFQSIRQTEKIRFKSAKALIKLKWDSFFVLFSGVDWISHRIYSQLINGKINKQALKYFKELDQYIAQLYQQAQPNSNLFIVSDHGFRATKYQFSLSQWLANQNLLTRKTSTSSNLAANILNIPMISDISFKIYQIVKQYIKLESVINEKINPAKTIASSDSYGIYINTKKKFKNGIVSSSNYSKITREIKRKLQRIKDPKYKLPVFKKVFLQQDIYHGSQTNLAPDIILIPNNHWQILSHLSVKKCFIYHPGNDHDNPGIFIANGPNITKNKTLKNLKMYDIAPTILHLQQTQIPINIDGKVIKQLFI